MGRMIYPYEDLESNDYYKKCVRIGLEERKAEIAEYLKHDHSIPIKLSSKYTPIIMDLKEKIEHLKDIYLAFERQKHEAHAKMKEIKKKISKYETVLKHAEEIESVEEKQPV